METRTEYHVRVNAVFHPSPGEDPCARDPLVDERVDSLEEARDLLAERLPVALDSGDPSHFDTGDGDEMNTGRVYHFWYGQVGRNGPPDLWTDAWVSVERVERTPVPYADVVPEAEPEHI